MHCHVSPLARHQSYLFCGSLWKVSCLHWAWDPPFTFDPDTALVWTCKLQLLEKFLTHQSEWCMKTLSCTWGLWIISPKGSGITFSTSISLSINGLITPMNWQRKTKTQINTRTYSHTHRQTQTHRHTIIHTQIQTHRDAHAHASTHTHSHILNTHIQTHTRIYTQSYYIHTQTHTYCMYIHTHTHTKHNHTHNMWSAVRNGTT